MNSSNFTLFIVSTEACDTYQRWKEEEFDINHLFSLEKREYRYKVTLLHVIVGDFYCLEEEKKKLIRYLTQLINILTLFKKRQIEGRIGAKG